jgi:hypothetical protein
MVHKAVNSGTQYVIQLKKRTKLEADDASLAPSKQTSQVCGPAFPTSFF